MDQQEIFLFCQYFPSKGGEQFLFNEVEYYPRKAILHVYSLHGGSASEKVSIPVIRHELSDYRTPIRQIVKQYWRILLKIFFNECIHSPHRMKYILKTGLHLNLLLGYFQKAIEIEKELPDKRITLYSYWFDEWAIILDLVKRISNKPLRVICRMHGFDFDEAQVVSGYHLFRYSNLKGIDSVFSVSEYGKRYTMQKYGFKGIEVSKLGVKDKGNNPFRNNFTKTIVSCSALISLKRVHLIVQLLKEIPLDINWVHFGNGPLEDDILSKALDLPANIHFEYKGQVDNIEIISFYNSESVDLFINVSELEGIPVSLMEAISFGIPVVGCNICGVPEIVNSQTGLLLEKDFDIQKTAGYIKEFITNKGTDQDFRNGVKDFWNLNYNANNNYPVFLNKHLFS